MDHGSPRPKWGIWSHNQVATLIALSLLAGSSPGLAVTKAKTKRQSATTSVASSREIRLSNYKYRNLKADLPIDTMVLDEQRILWMAGKTSVWRWNLQKNELQRVALLKSGNADRLRKIIVLDNKIVVMSNLRLFELRFKGSKLTQLRSKNKRVVSLNLSQGSRGLFWITTAGVYSADFSSQSLVHLSQAPNLYSLDQTVFLPESGDLWFVRKKKAYLRNLLGEKIQTKLIYSTKHAITGIHHTGDNIFLHTKHSVLRFRSNGLLRQRIPVEGQRKLVSMALNSRQHSYLFSDKLLEVFDLKRKREYHYRLNLGIVKKAKNLVTQGSMVAVIADGVPRSFQISGNWQ